MEQNSPENAARTIDRNIVSKIKSGEVVTCQIHKSVLPSYLKAGLLSSFKVKEIAKEGEEFACFLNLSDRGKVRVSKDRVMEDYIAVSIERPKAAKDHVPFWINLARLNQEKV